MADIYTVFGNPIAHSKSPDIHKFFSQSLNDNVEYGRVLVPEGKFEETATQFFNDGGLGCNITVPCKLDAYKFADELTDYAKSAGAVNTLKKLDNGKILGDNTDGRGLVYDLKRLGVELTDKNILICGAGGATQGILLPIFNEHPHKITIANRHAQKAVVLADAFDDSVQGCSYEELKCEYDVIINATASSLQNAQLPISDDIYKHASAAYDLMYKVDGPTIFLEKAKSLGIKSCFDGFGMLISQAWFSYILWRDKEPNLEATFEHFANAN